MLILDLWGISFHTVVVFDLVKNFLFKSALGHCGMKGKLKKDTCQTYRFCSHYLIGKNRSYAPHFIINLSTFKALERSLRHVWDKVTWWYFQSISKEVIWSKIFLNYMHGLKSAVLAIFQRGLGWPSPVSGAFKNAS